MDRFKAARARRRAAAPFGGVHVTKWNRFLDALCDKLWLRLLVLGPIGTIGGFVLVAPFVLLIGG